MVLCFLLAAQKEKEEDREREAETSYFQKNKYIAYSLALNNSQPELLDRGLRLILSLPWHWH